MAAAIGNQYAAKSRLFYDTLNRALKAEDGKRLRAAAEKLLDLAAEGEQWAVQELANRLDGKPHQAVALTDADGGPVRAIFEWSAKSE